MRNIFLVSLILCLSACGESDQSKATHMEVENAMTFCDLMKSQGVTGYCELKAFQSAIVMTMDTTVQGAILTCSQVQKATQGTWHFGGFSLKILSPYGSADQPLAVCKLPG